MTEIVIVWVVTTAWALAMALFFHHRMRARSKHLRQLKRQYYELDDELREIWNRIINEQEDE